jgi:hypothetical protein
MPEPTQISAAALPAENSDNTNITPAPIQDGGEKLSLSEFENYIPTGKSPAVSKQQDVKPAVTAKQTAASEDTNKSAVNNQQKVDDKDESAQKPEEMENEAEEQGEEKDGAENTEEGEDDLPAHDDKDDPKLHGNTKRDYAGFSAEEVKILKRLDVGRFNTVSQHWKALKTAAGKAVELAKEVENKDRLLKEGGIPQSWHEHPEAYQLSREFQDLSAQYAQQESLEQHYERQLLNVRQGKPWTAATVDPKSGQLIISQPYEASDQADVWVNREMLKATNNKGQLDGRAAGLKNEFAANHQRAGQQIKNEVDYVISKMHQELKPVEGDVKTVLNALPQQYQNHPLAYGYGQLGAIIMAQGRKLASLMGEQANKTRIEQDVRKAGAKTPKARPSGSAQGKEGWLSMKEFGDS